MEKKVFKGYPRPDSEGLARIAVAYQSALLDRNQLRNLAENSRSRLIARLAVPDDPEDRKNHFEYFSALRISLSELETNAGGNHPIDIGGDIYTATEAEILILIEDRPIEEFCAILLGMIQNL